MNQVFAGATTLILAFLLWSFGKKPRVGLLNTIGPRVLRVKDLTELTVVKRSNESKNTQNELPPRVELKWHAPKTAQEKINLRKQVQRLMSQGPAERLKAVKICALWGNPSLLPILRRGLKDSDSQVIAAAANAIEKYRVGTNSKNNQEETSRPPRNVALMR